MGQHTAASSAAPTVLRRDVGFVESLKGRRLWRKIERNNRKIACLEAAFADDDCTDEEFIARHRRLSDAQTENVRLLKLHRRSLVARFEPTPRPRRRMLPRSRRREHRPGAARRSSSSSRTSSVDPGDGDPEPAASHLLGVVA